MVKWSYYAVARGKKVGIYTNWNACKVQVDGFKGAKYKDSIQKKTRRSLFPVMEA